MLAAGGCTSDGLSAHLLSLMVHIFNVMMTGAHCSAPSLVSCLEGKARLERKKPSLYAHP